jgi:hypothetical protein
VPTPDSTRQDTYQVTVKIGDTKYGVWDKLSGGEVDSEEFKYKPGGMLPPVSLGGSKNVGNITISRLYRLGRDHTKAQDLINAVGKAVVTVTKQPLDVDGNAYGVPIVWNGILKRVTFPEHDSESSSPGLIEIEVTPEGYPVAS